MIVKSDNFPRRHLAPPPRAAGQHSRDFFKLLHKFRSLDEPLANEVQAAMADMAAPTPAQDSAPAPDPGPAPTSAPDAAPALSQSPDPAPAPTENPANETVTEGTNSNMDDSSGKVGNCEETELNAVDSHETNEGTNIEGPENKEGLANSGELYVVERGWTSPLGPLAEKMFSLQEVAREERGQEEADGGLVKEKARRPAVTWQQVIRAFSAVRNIAKICRSARGEEEEGGGQADYCDSFHFAASKTPATTNSVASMGCASLV